MKKTLFILFLILLTLISCKNPTTYESNNDMVELLAMPYSEIKTFPYTNNTKYRLHIKNENTDITDLEFNAIFNFIKNNKNIVEIILDENAFANCMNLTTINIPNKTVVIKDGAFKGCTNLVNVKLPSKVVSIGAQAFSQCNALTNITLPSGITTINDNTFSNCIALTSITIPSSVTSIGNNAFSNCNALKTITLPSSINMIATNAVSYCEQLESIIVDENNPSYSSHSGILYNKEKTIVFKVPECNTANLLNSTNTIEEYAFTSKKGDLKIILPNNIQIIKSFAFEGWNSIDMTIPINIKTVNDNAVICRFLAVRFNGTKEQWNAKQINFYPYERGFIKCSDETIPIGRNMIN